MQKEKFVALYWANKIADNEQPMVLAEEISNTLMEMVELCQKAIEDHYRLPTSLQPYNDKDAKIMVQNWFAKHIK